ncbi:MAG: tyrosine recombinase [Burkholderiales bacterium]|nr:tyrosine recombinase [Burkholderiales bacterium]
MSKEDTAATMPKTISAENRTLIDAFANAMGAQADKTRKAYVRDTERLAEAAHPLSLMSLTRIQIARQLAQWHGQGLSGRSLARMLSSWRAFYRFALAQPNTLRKDDPCEHLKAPRSVRRLPSALTPDEMRRLLDTPEDLLSDAVASAAELRDAALFELAYSSGLRVSELVGLDVDRVDLEQRETRVLGKGNKERIVPVGRSARDAVARWLVARAEILRAFRAEDEQALFVNRRGKRLSVRTVQKRLQQLAVARGLPQNVHPHILRHSFASHLLESSGDLRAVQELLGHASIASTQVYTHLDYQALAKVYDAAHPRARKK